MGCLATRLLSRSRHQPPRPQWQALELGGGGLDEHHEGGCANKYADDVGDIVPVTADLTGSATVDAAVLFGLDGAREGSSDEGPLQGVGRRGDSWRETSCLGEEINQLENENTRECATQVAHTRHRVSIDTR